MRLNPDCVREVLLITESLKPRNYVDLRLVETQFDTEELVYAGKKLIEAHYLKGNIMEFISGEPDEVTIREMTMSGHALLDNIRDPKVWSETKTIVSKLGTASLHIFSEVAASVITSMLLK